MHEDVARELDLLHEHAKHAFADKNLEAYMSGFSSKLNYKQPNGKTIGFDQLARDIKVQFDRVDEAGSSYERESLDVDGDRAIQVLIQNAWAVETILFFFKRRWLIKRKGKCEYERTSAGWKIVKVEVLEERVA